MTILLSVFRKWALQVLLASVVIGGVSLGSYFKGIEHQKLVQISEQQKADDKIDEKNQGSQDAADGEAKTQVVYKDRIITKYKTITKEIIKYEKTDDANVYLDPEFIRLHDAAAATYDQDQITTAPSGTVGQAPTPGITTGDAIGVITRNYEKYQQCSLQVSGWQRFYGDLQKKINAE